MNGACENRGGKLTGPGICAVVCAVLATELVCGSPLSPQESVPFRSGIQLVNVDVIVTDRSGQPVRGLTIEDFQIFDDRRRQEIRGFSMVDIPFAPSATIDARGQVGVEPDAASTIRHHRTYVILLDGPSTSAAPVPGYAYTMLSKQIARRFVEDVVQPDDQVAVIHVQGTSTDAQGFTSRKPLVLASIDRFGRGPSGNDVRVTDEERVTRNLDTYRVIKEISERLGTFGGRRKAIVWIGGQIDTHPERRMSRTRQSNPIAAAAGLLRAAYRDAINASIRNNVAIYPIDPSGLGTGLGMDELIRISSLREIAEDTGGLALVNTNNVRDGFAAILRDLSVHYLLGYSPDPAHSDGLFHAIEVRVDRPNVTVRARRGYYSEAQQPSERRAR